MENKDLIHKNINKYMKIAIQEAKKAYNKAEVPVGAVIVSDTGNIISKSYNKVEMAKNPLYHAEILAITKACKKLNQKYLNNCSIFITLEPCPMCATAISLAKIQNIYFSSMDEKGGAIINSIQLYKNAKNLYKPNIFSGFLEIETSELLKNFFKELRMTKKDLKKKDKVL